MPRIELHDPRTGTTAWITPEIGFNCFRFAVTLGDETIEVIDAQPGFEEGLDRPTRSGIPLLFPFPNRIRHGRFTWDGKEYDLPKNPQGHAIHGFVFDCPWRVTHADAISATGEFQLSRDAPDRRELWPADFVIEVRYSIRGTALSSEITVRNPDVVPLPWGFGTHSYFKVPLSPKSSKEQCLLQIPARAIWTLEENLPTGERRKLETTEYADGRVLGGATFDDVLTDLDVGKGRLESLVMDPKAGIQVLQTSDPGFREMVAFTPPHGRSVCMEPYTCVTDAINLQAQGVDAGLRVLPPGGEAKMGITIEASRVMV